MSSIESKPAAWSEVDLALDRLAFFAKKGKADMASGKIDGETVVYILRKRMHEASESLLDLEMEVRHGD